MPLPHFDLPRSSQLPVRAPRTPPVAVDSLPPDDFSQVCTAHLAGRSCPFFVTPWSALCHPYFPSQAMSHLPSPIPEGPERISRYATPLILSVIPR